MSNDLLNIRDPRLDPKPGDTVKIDLGEGDFETRTVLSIERHGDNRVVKFYVDGNVKHIRETKLKHWRDYLDDAEVVQVA